MTEVKAKGNVPEKASGVIEAVAEKHSAPVEKEEWIFTLTNNTGELLKVERLDKASGERKELSEEEYSAWYSSAVNPYGDTSAEYSFDPYTYETAYYHGMADYETALSQASQYGASPEEQAYYQGMADYEAALTSGEYDYSAEQQAYYQGIADYAASL